MTFKQNNEQENVKDPVKEGLLNLIQFEIDKLSLISSAKHYFYNNGLMTYKKFFK